MYIQPARSTKNNSNIAWVTANFRKMHKDTSDIWYKGIFFLECGYVSMICPLECLDFYMG
jgi:hypothetical protein